jgi:hypothetical protein
MLENFFSLQLKKNYIPKNHSFPERRLIAAFLKFLVESFLEDGLAGVVKFCGHLGALV